jgi:hypothetical protein
MDEVETLRAQATDRFTVAALVGLLFCVYLLTASFVFISGDELFLFDATESIARHQSIARSETGDIDWPGESQAEPAQPFLAAFIYLIANSFDGIGNVHATMLFNPVMTALTGGLVFLYVRQLEYERSTAVAAGLAFGLTTIAWPYTKTFFREPLTTLMLFATAFAVLRWRNALARRERPAHLWLAGALGLALGGIFTKEAVLVGLPVLLLILLPGRVAFKRPPKDWTRIAVIVGVALAVGALGVGLYLSIFGEGRFKFAERMAEMAGNLRVAPQGLLGYLFSPGKSLFLYSPVLLLALAAPFVKSPRRADTSWPFVLLAVFVVVYALVRGELWWGGANWGPRYMVPLTPFLIVAATPVIDLALHGKSRFARVALVLLIILIVAGVAVQIGGIAVRLSDYDELVGKIKEGGPWTLALWTPYYSPILGHWRLLGVKPPDFAWIQALPAGPAWAVPALAGGLALVFAVAIGVGLTRIILRRVIFGTVLTGFLLTGAMTWLSLRALYYDQRYHGNDETLHKLNAALRAIESPDPVIYLNNRAYFEFMLNYYKGYIVWYTLALNPNELLAPGQPPPAPSTDPTTLVSDRVWKDTVTWFNSHHQTAFLVMEHGPFTPESPRPLEWAMSREYFYVGVQEFSPTVRLVQFSTVVAPPLEQPAVHQITYQLGDSVALVGWDAVPDGTPLRPGSILNISTQWQAAAAPGADYKIGTYLMNPQGTVAMQDDSVPVNGFWPASAWLPGDVIRHNVAFVLPGDLMPGFYEVWTLMYSPLDGARLPVQDTGGTAIRDHVVLFSVEVIR